MEKEHLLGKTLEELQTVAEENGLPRFAAKQIASWLYEKRIDHIAGMSNLSLKHRELLSQRYDIGREAPVQSLRSTDGTIKYLFFLHTSRRSSSVWGVSVIPAFSNMSL